VGDSLLQWWLSTNAKEVNEASLFMAQVARIECASSFEELALEAIVTNGEGEVLPFAVAINGKKSISRDLCLLL